MYTVHPKSKFIGSKERCCYPDCANQAGHKLAEEQHPDDEGFLHHPLTSWVCCEHFVKIMGLPFQCKSVTNAQRIHCANCELEYFRDPDRPDEDYVPHCCDHPAETPGRSPTALAWLAEVEAYRRANIKTPSVF